MITNVLKRLNIFPYIYLPFIIPLLCKDNICLFAYFSSGMFVFCYYFIEFIYIFWILIMYLLNMLPISYPSFWLGFFTFFMESFDELKFSNAV